MVLLFKKKKETTNVHYFIIQAKDEINGKTSGLAREAVLYYVRSREGFTFASTVVEQTGKSEVRDAPKIQFLMTNI